MSEGISFLEIDAEGRSAVAAPSMDEIGPAFAALYARAGFVRPWIGYVAVHAGVPVGACGFKGPPLDGRVEIAYQTFPGFEGRGIATEMARRLVRLAEARDPAVLVTARTLPKKSASTSILRKLGFLLQGIVEDSEDGPVWEWLRPGTGDPRPGTGRIPPSSPPEGAAEPEA